MRADKVLFVLKRRGGGYDPVQSDTGEWANRSFTGLSNSVRYVVEMLQHLGITAKMVEVNDNDDIDREVTSYKPSHVVIEALWVVPAKFEILTKLHPAIHWQVRLHSELPFIAGEGIAIDWIFGYLKHQHVTVSANSERMRESLQHLTHRQILHTPNYYPLAPMEQRGNGFEKTHFDVGCFGAIRPLKNQLMQAVAAIRFADEHRMWMRYHINGDRMEGGGLPVLHNLRALFANSHHTLVEHQWLDAGEFIKLVRRMDLGLQVSFTETFNIVSADMAVADVPLVTSPEVRWTASMFQADPNSEDDIVRKMQVAWAGRLSDLQRLNYEGLAHYDHAAQRSWLVALGHEL